MDTQDIASIMRGSKATSVLDKFRGVFPLDIFMREMTRLSEGIYIFNTDPSGSPGRHWLAVYSDGEVCEFFDSYGLPISFYSLESFFDKLDLTVVNPQMRLQGELSTTCGDYAVLFCLLRSEGWSFTTIISRFLKVKNTHERDHLVRYFISDVISHFPDNELENIHVQVAIPFCDYE